ncbi:MAG TPA: CHAT domain-containing protein [Saprospiraceae bacterium]|nr:CHAT domain-containing protein [Saprospiraceae bacterium]
MDQILAISERELGRVSRETADILHQLARIQNFKYNSGEAIRFNCEAGIGKLQRGEGIISLSRAFAYAGAKSIVTTLWAVKDKSTKDFMLAFYSNMENWPKAEALWQTRKDFLKKHKGEAAHPYYWAGFIGVGDM